MTKHWLATFFLAASLTGVTAGAGAQTSPPGAGAAQPAVVPMPAQVVAPDAPAVPQLAQMPAPAPTVPVPTQPAPVATQSLFLEAGAGVLVQLPRPAATIIAANPAVARVQPASPTSIFVIGIAQGRTNLIATNEAGQAIVQYEIVVRRAGSGGGDVVPQPVPAGPVAPPPPSGRDLRAGNASAAQSAIRQHVNGAGAVTVSAVEGNLVLAGTIATPQQSLNVETIAKSFTAGGGGLINNMVVLSSLQVNVRVRMVEMSRSVSRDLGINWNTVARGAGGLLGPGGIVFGTFAASAAKTDPPFLPFAIPGANYGAALGRRFGDLDVYGVIDALALDNLVSILAEPNLTTQSGEPASFLAGGEFPVPVAQGGGVAGAITVEFKQFGVGLAVVPTVLAPGRISMRIRPEVSEPDPSSAVSICAGCGPVFGLTTRRAETTVELGSGQSFAIAGLLSHKITDNASMFPWLGDLPIVGALFKSTKFLRRETELVIIVTPYIVQPVSASSQLRTPGDNYRPATDLNRILRGRQSQGRDSSGTVRPLDAGFILK